MKKLAASIFALVIVLSQSLPAVAANKGLPVNPPVVVAPSSQAAVAETAAPAASSEKTSVLLKGQRSEINVAYKDDGYISARYLSATSKKLKVKVIKGTTEYTYDLPGDAKFVNFPLQMGNGDYTIKVYENIESTRYSVVQTEQIKVSLTSSLAPYLASVQNINFNKDSKAVKKAEELVKGKTSELAKVEAVFGYIVKNIKYDKDKAANVKSGYLPTIDDTLATNKGICFDYSSLMASMLRSQGLPTKMVFGYVPSGGNQVYHAWNEVYITGTGWVKINGSVYFDGVNWSRMDSTFAAGNSGGGLSKFIGDGSNYKYEKEF